MTPEQKRQKLKEMEDRVREKHLTLRESGQEVSGPKSTYVWHNDELILVPKSILD